MRVLMLSWDYPPQVSGGTAAHVAGLSGALHAAGHEVAVMTIADRRADLAAERAAPVRIVRAAVDLPWLSETEVVARIASANHAVVKLDGQLAGWTPDVVHGHDWRLGWAADVIASRYRVPFVLTMHGTERVRHGGHLPKGAPNDINAVEWWLAFQADRLIAPTRFIVDQLVTDFEISPERVARVPNGIDPALWQPPERGPGDHAPGDVPSGDVGPSEREPLVVTWGRVQYEKGFQVLARAMNQVRATIPHVQCSIAGRGSYLPELQTQIDVEGVSDLIELPGYLSDDALRTLAHRAGCVVIPSLYEPFGVVALEALAARAPLIVARTGGLAELIEGTDAGLTFEPGNSDDLARCIVRVLSSPSLAADLSAHAAELIERRYTWDAIAEATVRVYAAAIAA